MKYRIVQVGKENKKYLVEERVWFFIFPYWSKVLYKEFNGFDFNYRVKEFDSYTSAISYIKSLIDSEYKEVLTVKL